MKKNKDITIAGMDLDSWLESEPEVTETIEIQHKGYTARIVAFLDLLAIKDLIFTKTNPGEDKEALSIIAKIKWIVESETKDLERDLEFTLLNLSDSYIFTCSDEHIFYLITLLGVIQMRILRECQFQLRGAVTYGNVYVSEDGKQIIGPAYINAYLLQEYNAIYPRIILDKTFLDRFNELNHDPQFLTVAADNETFIDYVEIFLSSDTKQITNAITSLKRDEVFSYLIDGYKFYHNNDKPSVKQKYGWTIQYFIRKGVWPDDKRHKDWQGPIRDNNVSAI